MIPDTLPSPSKNQILLDRFEKIVLDRDTFLRFYELKLQNPNTFGALNCRTELKVFC